MIRKEGNDPQLYTITRKSTNARRQSSNGSSTSSVYNNNLQNSPTSPIGSIPNDEEQEDFDDDEEFPDDKHFNSKDLKEQHLNLIAFDGLEKLTKPANNLTTLNLAASYLAHAAPGDPLNKVFFMSNESALIQQSRRPQLFASKKSNKQPRSRKLLKTVR